MKNKPNIIVFFTDQQRWDTSGLHGNPLSLMENFDCIMLPTVGTEYKIADVLSDPVRLNKNMGYYTYFANPIGLPVIAVPASMKKNGIPFGISLVTEPLEDRKLLHLGRLWQGANEISAGLR